MPPVGVYVPDRRVSGPPSVVIGHDFSVTFGGAERVSAVIARRFPEAPFWSLLGSAEVARRMGVEDRFRSMLPSWDWMERHYRLLSPLHPAIVRSRPLPEADVLFTSSYAFAHGFQTANRAPHVCYCISPLRFAWSMTEDYADTWARRRGLRPAFRGLAAVMRTADRRMSKGVTRYLAVSEHAARQVRECYGRDAEVVWPPVDTEKFRPSGDDPEDYYLFCGRLIEPYKRPTIVLDAFSAMPDRRLVIAGDGPAMPQLRARAGANVEFLGQLGDRDLVSVMQRCRAAIFPSSDDFGLIPVEVMACGRPVLAYAGGGALETVAAGTTGEFFEHQDAETVRGAVEAFDPEAYAPATIRAHAERWAIPRFHDAISRAVTEAATAG